MHKKGFTLVELLIVVLIIGILSAVALPNYRRAIEKARLSEGLIIAKSMVNAIQRYVQANPNETRACSRLDIADIDLKGGVWAVGKSPYNKGGTSCDVFVTPHFFYMLGSTYNTAGIDVMRRDNDISNADSLTYSVSATTSNAIYNFYYGADSTSSNCVAGSTNYKMGKYMCDFIKKI